MPLQLPNLDDRRWADLVEEARALVPFLAPRWTDHNVSDPGIMLIELLAWITEQDIYRLNRIPPRHVAKFLELIGLRPHPVRPARGVLSIALKHGASPMVIPADFEFTTTPRDGDAPPIAFRALRQITAQPIALASVSVDDLSQPVDYTARWERGDSYHAFGTDPQPGAALLLGFDRPILTAQSLTLHFTLAGEDDDHETAADEAQPTTHHSARVQWEYSTGPSSWALIDDVVDRTRSLSSSGSIDVCISDTHRAVQGRYLVRGRLTQGQYDRAPVLRGIAVNGLEIEQAVPFAETIRIPKGVIVQGTTPGAGERVGIHLECDRDGSVAGVTFTDDVPDAARLRVLSYDPPTAQAEGLLQLEALRLKTEQDDRSTGRPLQVFTLAQSALERSFSLVTIERATKRDRPRARPWTLRSSLDSAGMAEAVAVCDPVKAQIRFGDGEHGLVPPDGAIILATGLFSLAQAGNVAASAVNQIANSARNRSERDYRVIRAALDMAKTTNRLTISGGRSAETVAQAAARAADEREARHRAVTLEDYEDLARRVPGTAVARAHAIANAHPAFACTAAPGIITLIVLPHLPVDRPSPSPGLLRRVSRYLEPRRVLGTRLFVVGPTDVLISVRATVAPRPGAIGVDVRRRALGALRDFFHPLSGGPDRTGWPLGRDVYRSEVMAALDEVTGVDHVLELEVLVGEQREPTCGNVCLGATGLPDARDHEIQIVTTRSTAGRCDESSPPAGEVDVGA